MEFLSRPRDPICDGFEVPCLSTEPYDGGEFKAFPQRRGWGPRPNWEWHIIFDNPSERFRGFIQTWLFFGPMEVVFQTRINPMDFVQQATNPTRLLFTTREFWPIYRRWYTSVDRYQQEQRLFKSTIGLADFLAMSAQIRGGELEKRGRQNMDRVVDLFTYIQSTAFKDPRDEKFKLLSNFMGDILFRANNSYIRILMAAEENKQVQFNKEFYLALPKSPNLVEEWESSLWMQMREHGWCPAELTAMYHRLHPTAIYFMSQIQRPGPDKEHKMVRVRPKSMPLDSMTAKEGDTTNDDPPKLCQSTSCGLNQLDEDSYRTKHADTCKGEGCWEMSADPVETRRILESGNIPLILSIDEDDESEQVTLVESEPGLKYVAISHVWSDGLGNTKRSALPRCQMVRLSHLIRGLEGRGSDVVLFWIDTIGCPPDAADDGETQQLAIGMMRKTYQDACVVLVLDSWLLSQEIGPTAAPAESQLRLPMSDHEILLRIITSSWNARLWTLQEGALASTLFFQFDDKAYDVDEGVERLNHLDDSTGDHMKGIINNLVNEIRGFMSSKLSPVDAVKNLIGVLQHRSTSVASDEAICTAALMGFDVEQFARTEPEKRMALFWSLVTKVPRAVLGITTAKLPIPGLRWAPESLLRHPDNTEKTESSPGIVGKNDDESQRDDEAINTGQGLSCKFFGLSFHMGNYALGDRVFIRDEKGDWFQIELKTDRIKGVCEIWTEDTGILEKNHTVDINQLYQSDWLVFLSVNDRQRHSELSELYLQIGYLAVITKQEGDTIYARNICEAASTKLMPSVHGHNIQLLDQFARQSPVACNRMSGTLLYSIARSSMPNISWCID